MRAIQWYVGVFVAATLGAACGSSNNGGDGFGTVDAYVVLDAGRGPLPDATLPIPDASFTLPDTGHLDATAPKDSGSKDGAGAKDSAPQDSAAEAAPPCDDTCSSDFSSVVDCHGTVLQTCMAGTSCDLILNSCETACEAAEDDKQSAGCEYYATMMDNYESGVCFAAFVANTWTSPAHITVDYAGASLPVASFAFTPSGSGPSLTYAAFDPTAGIAPGGVVILFLAGSASGAVPCPEPTAMATAGLFNATGVSNSFHITSDVPVASYQINPYGGGSAAVTGASLLLPTSVWSENYLAVTVSPNDIAGPSMNIIANTDNTTVTITPTVAITGGGTLPAGPAGTPYTFTLDKGQEAQFSQTADLTGSAITASAPIGFMAGQPCMREPVGVAYCDHGEQMIPPLESLGASYAAVMFRPRVAGDEAIWHMVGAADGTTLTYSSAVGGPATLDEGQIVDFITDTPFTVTSQDTLHPFMLFTYMSGSQWSMLSNTGGYGDPDFVLAVPPAQYESDYVFFADPTYPETDLVIVREANAGVFEDVTLDCAGVLTGWQTVGDYQWTRADLITGNFQGVGNCSTGRHEISSAGKFGLTVWGWGTPLTTQFTANVSYGYPGGMNVQKINRL